MRKKTQTEFDAIVREHYGDTLDTSGFVYSGYHSRGVVVCPIHGPYEVSAHNLLKGMRCAKCYHDSRVGKFKSSTAEFVERAVAVHGDAYDYSNTVFLGAKKKLTIVCKKHGQFEQEAWSHLSGRGCSPCADERVGLNCRLTQEQFLSRALEIHGDTYDLSESEYESQTRKVKVICKVHGAFYPKAGNFLNRKSGCPTCASQANGVKARRNEASFISAGVKAHEGRFGYGKVRYKDSSAYMSVICPVHGRFEQLAQDHIKGIGCVKCSKPVYDQASFIVAAKSVHGDQYDYTLSAYTRALEKVTITCPSHGTFEQTPSCHINSGQGCPSCAKVGPSKGQLEILEFISSHTEVISEKPVEGSKMRFDVFLPLRSLAVEYHGLIWHSTAFAPEPTNDHRKHMAAAAQGIRVIHIYEDEWKSKRPIVERLLLSAIGTLPTVFARKTELRDIGASEACGFFNDNHLQGASKSSLYLGLFSRGTLVACMAFGVCRSIRHNTDPRLWELQRYASTHTVVGGASKLLSEFLRRGLAHTLVSYSDNRLFTGNMYLSLGFALEHESPPDYCYVSNNSRVGRIHKSRFQRKHLPKMLEIFDPEKTEVENCAENGWFQLFDCGKKKWALSCI